MLTCFYIHVYVVGYIKLICEFTHCSTSVAPWVQTEGGGGYTCSPYHVWDQGVLRGSRAQTVGVCLFDFLTSWSCDCGPLVGLHRGDRWWGFSRSESSLDQLCSRGSAV